MASNWYGSGVMALMSASVDLAGGTIVAILCESGYTPDQDADEFVSDLTNECADASYSRVTLTGLALSYDTATNTCKWTADPIEFPLLDETFRYMVLAVDSGSDATSQLIKWSNYTTDQTAAAVDTTITPNAAGLAAIVVA